MCNYFSMKALAASSMRAKNLKPQNPKPTQNPKLEPETRYTEAAKACNPHGIMIRPFPCKTTSRTQPKTQKPLNSSPKLSNPEI